MKKILLGLLGLFLVVLLALPVANYFASLKIYQAQREEGLKEFDKVSGEILADLKLLEEKPLIHPHSFNSNADVLFSQYVSWQGGDLKVLDDDNHQKMIAFGERHKQWAKEPKVLQEMLRDPELDQIDVSWLSQVQNYDHWSIIDNEHIKPELERAKGLDAIARVGLFASLPIPSYSELQTWSTIYVLQMHKKHKTVEGLKVYRKTAELIYGSGFLIPSMIVVSFFNRERFLVENLKVAKWQVPDEKVVKAFKRVSWAWVGILNNSFALEMPPEFKKMIKFENGICSAPFEAVMGQSMLYDYFEPRVAFETDHAEDVKRLTATTLQFQSECHTNTLNTFNERTPASVNDWRPKRDAKFVTEGNSVTWFSLLEYVNVSRIPYVRRMLGYVFVAVTNPNYFKLYNPDRN